jgi:hypothetical protein
MAILDRIEVLISLPSISRVLHEFRGIGAGKEARDLVPWAFDARQQGSFVMAPEGRTFVISIRLMPLFNFENADGIHVSLKIDDGRAVNHYYSIKFSEMEIDKQGGLTTSIHSAIIQKGACYRSVLFSFGTSNPGQSSETPRSWLH